MLVVHDWGSALGFDWASRYRDRIGGIAYMEAIVRPVASWDEWSPSATPIFQGFRSDKGEQRFRPQDVGRAGAAGVDLAEADRGRDDGISSTVLNLRIAGRR